jgi:hypothetical protein
MMPLHGTGTQAPLAGPLTAAYNARMSPIKLFPPLLLALLLVMALLPRPATAQDTSSVHWAYASLLGTGWYQLSGERQVFVIRVPPSWQYREADLAGDGLARAGIRLQVPLTLGLHRLEEIDDLLDPDNIGTLSFTPGVEIEYPVDERWRLLAYGHLGWGSDFSGDQSAWIYDLGLRSRYALQHNKLDWGLLGEVFWAGYSPDNGELSTLGGYMVGADFSYPLAWQWRGAAPLRLNWDISYRRFMDDLSFVNRAAVQTFSIQDEWDLGVALAPRQGRIKLGWFSVEQAGLSWRRSSDGDFRAITLNFSGPFNR